MGLRARVALRRDRERPAFILMNADHWQTVNELFHEALALTSDARRAFLTEVDGRDPRLAAEAARFRALCATM